MNNNKNTDVLSVVIPVYNSQETIKILVEQLKKALSCFENYQIILVNDYSTRITSYNVCYTKLLRI